MSEQTGAAGSIYDLGYRPYEGERLGRQFAILSLYIYSLRAVFGLGRSTWAKVFPIGLALLALVPAGAQLAIAAISPLDVEIIRPEDYFGYVQIILALFCAVVAPELIGRDQRYRTLSLYFSRALSRSDYVAAKFAALSVAILGVILLPQVALYLGSGLAHQDVVGYLKDDIGRVPPVLGSSVIVAVYMSSVSLAIASQTSRRAFATGAILAFFVIMTTLGAILIETTTGGFRSASIFVSPIGVLDGAVRWIFAVEPPSDSGLAKADVNGGYLFIGAVTYSAVALALLFRRFQKLTI